MSEILVEDLPSKPKEGEQKNRNHLLKNVGNTDTKLNANLTVVTLNFAFLVCGVNSTDEKRGVGLLLSIATSQTAQFLLFILIFSVIHKPLIPTLVTATYARDHAFVGVDVGVVSKHHQLLVGNAFEECHAVGFLHDCCGCF